MSATGNGGGVKRKDIDKVEEVRRWFARAVTCEGEPYVMDAEQVAAAIDESQNAIVVARAGSGKTRTIVAKIVYLVARCGVKPEEIMAFVFNANAAKEINERLGKMRVDGVLVMGGVKVAETEINDGSAKAVIDNNMRAGVGGNGADKDNDYEYQAIVNTIIGSLRNRFAEAVFSRCKYIRMMKINRIMTEIQRSVVPIRPGKTAVRYENTRKTKYHHNKKSNL